MQLMTSLKQFFAWVRKDSHAENSMETLSDIAPKKHMLFEGDFNRDLKRLYSLGRSSYQPPSLKNLSDDEELGKKLHNLHCLLGAWEDSGLSRGNEENKKQRHALKHKKDLAKPIRRRIHKALEIEVVNLVGVLLAEVLERCGKDSENIVGLGTALIDVKTAKEASGKISGEQLIDLTSKCLHALKAINPDLKSPENKDIEKRFKKAASAVTSFKTLGQKILASLSVSVAVIAALACGFFTGGFIYVLLGGFGVAAGVAIGVAALAGIFGFTVNVRFFSKSLPEFLLKLTNPSRITEFINEEGKREQFSNLKKYVYLPLAALFSVAVGISFGAFSLAQLAAILGVLPILAATGPLPIILAGVLAITMIIVMFKAFVEIAPKLSFSQLGLSLQTAWKEMSFMKFLSYAITLAVCGIGIFGLAMACHAGFGTLVGYFGGPAAIFVLATSFAGQLPFNLLTVSTFCREMGNFLLSIPKRLMGIPEKVKNLFRQTQAQSGEVLEKSSFLNKMTSAGRYVWDSIIIPVFLVFNAIFNGAGIMLGKPSTAEYVAGAAGALNSISGNLVIDTNAQERSQADDKAIQKLKDSLASDNTTQEKSQVDNVATAIQKPEAPKVDETQPDNPAKVNFREEMPRPNLLPFFNDSRRSSVSSGQPSPSSSLSSEDSGRPRSDEDSSRGEQEPPRMTGT